MKLFSVSKGKIGNTTLTTVSVHPVSVIEVNVEKRTVTASWNSNAARIYREITWSKWRAKEPLLIRSGLRAFGHTRGNRAEKERGDYLTFCLTKS